MHINGLSYICYPGLFVFIAAVNIEDDFTPPSLAPAGNKCQGMTVGVWLKHSYIFAFIFRGQGERVDVKVKGYSIKVYGFDLITHAYKCSKKSFLSTLI